MPIGVGENSKEKGRGTSASMVSKDGKVAVTRWYDNKAVTMASNFVTIDDEDTAKRWSKTDKCYIEVKRPAVARMYNSSMGGVDKTDFLVALYRTKIQWRKWTLRMIFHVINASVVNAWLEYRSDAAARGLIPAKQLDLLDFTLHISEALARADSLPKMQKRGRPSHSPLT
ncbi:piggyBac transposable element-derived protein 2-like [Dermacentor andersoni]|uniref:piggyBac transposable element-derived protein 2-like n=1 Tax=Dermacentor andersoni TaxID=34620 RepID=UPI003B3BC166